MEPKRIIWHHSADLSQEHQFDKINEYHKSRGFPLSSRGFFVGYHWLIEPDGTVKQSREESEIGAHDAGENIDSVGICLAGNFSESMPNQVQTVAACKLIDEIRARWGIKINRIEPHRWDDTTECPGTLLEDNWLVIQYLQRHPNNIVRAFGLHGECLKLF